jgi:hypothetical protein
MRKFAHRNAFGAHFRRKIKTYDERQPATGCGQNFQTQSPQCVASIDPPAMRCGAHKNAHSSAAGTDWRILFAMCRQSPTISGC